MAIKLTLAMPESAIKRLVDGYRSGDPALLLLLRDFGVLAIQPHDERALDAWENEGGR